jgi:excisionase family DNA binding protein
MKSEHPFEKCLSIEELVQATGLKKSFIRKAMREYGFPHIKLGRLLRFQISDVQKWIAERKMAG